ncbi:hypothetical protein CEXT_739601 [Caerostris extrusa]|uniref:Uncharacterized protein n=1 Tax=Caerostris extrusa TaxID=172846 RepID=A0AAV4VV10_CAEEX|nr:hypothetical protein CEXT_739601 [Caerostris extrusa]
MQKPRKQVNATPLLTPFSREMDGHGSFLCSYGHREKILHFATSQNRPKTRSKTLLSTRKYLMLKVRTLISGWYTRHALAMFKAWFVATRVTLRSTLMPSPAPKRCTE